MFYMVVACSYLIGPLSSWQQKGKTPIGPSEPACKQSRQSGRVPRPSAIPQGKHIKYGTR